MKQIFMDTYVIIDFLAERETFSLQAAKLFDLAYRKQISIYISAVSYNNIYYILQQSLTHNSTIKLLEELGEIVEIADVIKAIIKQSLKSEFKDYENAIQYYCALSIPKVDFIVTRNSKDFKKSSLPVFTPIEALFSISNY